MILWIYLLGFGVPGLLQTRASGSAGSIIWGSFALVITYSAYVAEVFRAGIESVHEIAAGGGPFARAVERGRRCGRSCSRRRCAGSCRR